MNEIVRENTTEKGNAKLVYILYLVGLLFGLAGIVGVVIAYVNKSDAPAWLQTHYQFQIRTFWIGALYIILGGILALVLIGWFILLFWAIWLIVRSVKGMQALDKGLPIAEPKSWFF
ncbi:MULTISPECIES: DUF4870 family protein [unclassified Alishewanella]|uniref:DUF4870 family protein n=1 Tax=unclassified Alishewanella TaxID=2628974 RepID=UPI0040437306